MKYRTQPRGLTDKQKDIMNLAVKGLTNREIAEALHKSPNTIALSLCDYIYPKLGADTKKAAIAIYLQDHHDINEANTPHLLTVKEASNTLHMSDSLLRYLSDNGIIPCTKVGPANHRRYQMVDLLNYKPIPKTKRTYPLLSPRQSVILDLISYGNSNKLIAQQLGISQQTVKNHVSLMLKKLKVNDRAHLVATCFRNGLLQIDTNEIKKIP